MSTIYLEKQSRLPPDQAFQKVKLMLADDPDLRKLDSSYQCRFEESALRGSAQGKKFQATLSIQQNGSQGSVVKLEVKLPFFIAPFKGMVEKTLEKKLATALG